jgi:hypothetical protein
MGLNGFLFLFQRRHVKFYVNKEQKYKKGRCHGADNALRDSLQDLFEVTRREKTMRRVAASEFKQKFHRKFNFTSLLVTRRTDINLTAAR